MVEKLFLTEAECAKRIGIATEEFGRMISGLERQGFPRPDALFADRRYWPAVRAWLDRRYHLQTSDGVTAPPGLDVQEPWK